MRPVLVVAACLATLASALLVPRAAGQDAAEVTTVKEPGSGIEMPRRLSVLDGSATHELTGLALREKTIFKVDVYVCGHYVDASAVRSELADWKGRTAEELGSDEAFRKKLLAPGFARTLRLRLARDIDADDFNDAFEESLRPRMERLLADGEQGSLEDLGTLRGYFSLDELAEGTELDFTWAGGKLTTAMGGKQLGVLASPALCRALWDVYFGKDPIQPEFPRRLVSRFPDILGAVAPEPAEAGADEE